MGEEFIDRVYDTLVTGLREKYRVPGVEYAFDNGHVCLELYGKALAAYRRICERLGLEGEEDDDAEEIFDAFMDLQREIGYRMYRYGAEFGLDGERFTGALENLPTKEEILGSLISGDIH